MGVSQKVSAATKFIAAQHIANARTAALVQSGRRNISLLFHTPKKATSKSCVIRRRLRSKMTSLVMGHNADAMETDQPARPLSFSRSCANPKQRPATPYPPLNLVCRPLQEGERLILQGDCPFSPARPVSDAYIDWTYLVIPNLALYKMPLPNLVQAVRKALLSLGHQSMRLESSWSLPKTQARLPHRKRACPR